MSGRTKCGLAVSYPIGKMSNRIASPKLSLLVQNLSLLPLHYPHVNTCQNLWIRDLKRLQDGCQGSPGCSAVNQNEAPRNQETTKKQSYPWLPLQSVMPLQSGATYSGGNRLRLPTNLCFAYARCADIPSLTITRCWSAGLMNKTVRNPCIKSLNIFCFLF